MAIATFQSGYGARAGGAYNAVVSNYLFIFEAAELNWASVEFLSEQGLNPWSEMPVSIPQQNDYAGFSTRSNARAIAAGWKADDNTRPLP